MTPFGVLYLADDGLRLFNLSSSLPIAEEAYLDLTAIEIQNRGAVVCAWDRRRKRYLMAVPDIGETTNTKVWELHYGERDNVRQSANLYKRLQDVSCFGFYQRTEAWTFEDVPDSMTFQDIPLSFDDPTLLSSYASMISGDYTGLVHEHEFTCQDRGETVEAFIELGPYPKDPAIQALTDKRLKEIRMRVHGWPNSTMKVYVRPTHEEDYILVQTVDMSVYIKGDTAIVPVDLTGEQFFIKLVDDSELSSTRVYMLGIYGSHTGAPRRQ